LSGCDPNNISIGDLVCDASSPAPVGTRFEARIVLFNNIEVPITKVIKTLIIVKNLLKIIDLFVLLFRDFQLCYTIKVLTNRQ
jgi:hypothetical protein